MQTKLEDGSYVCVCICIWLCSFTHMKKSDMIKNIDAGKGCTNCSLKPDEECINTLKSWTSKRSWVWRVSMREWCFWCENELWTGSWRWRVHPACSWVHISPLYVEILWCVAPTHVPLLRTKVWHSMQMRGGRHCGDVRRETNHHSVRGCLFPHVLIPPDQRNLNCWIMNTIRLVLVWPVSHVSHFTLHCYRKTNTPAMELWPLSYLTHSGSWVPASPAKVSKGWQMLGLCVYQHHILKPTAVLGMC